MSARSDVEAWLIGIRLALDLLQDSASSGLDDMAMQADYRDGRPQANIVGQFLRKLREVDDRRVDAAFGSVLSEFFAMYADGIDLGAFERDARASRAQAVRT